MSLRDLIHQQWLAQQKASQASSQQSQSKPPQEPKNEGGRKDKDGDQK